jgi:hypothetical protein
MRNFDLKEDLSFEICGERFDMKIVRPEVLALWEDEKEPDSGVKALEIVDRRIVAFLAEEQHDRWKALRKRPENTPSMGQLREILQWMIEVQTARPTQQPSASAPGRGASAAISAVG